MSPPYHSVIFLNCYNIYINQGLGYLPASFFRPPTPDSYQMTTPQLKNLIKKGETQTLEFKAAFSNEAVETIAAFSNSNGGTVGNANHLMTPDEVAQAHYKTFNSSWDYPLAAPAAAAAKPGLTWVSATEGYFTLP